MSVQFLGPDPVEQDLRVVLDTLAAASVAGSVPIARLESHRIDLKEDAARRGPGGILLDGEPRSDVAARALAPEVACMANTPGGGALVVGVGDDGTLLGTPLEPEWLRHRLYELSDRRITADTRAVTVAGVRLVTVRVPEALEPVRYAGRLTWRVDDHCVEVDAATVLAGRMIRIGYDWSAQPSGHQPSDVRAVALDYARRYLRESNDAYALELVDASDRDLLHGLNTVTSEGQLTNAAALVFIGRADPALDYLRRDLSGGDSRVRVHTGGRSVLEELAEVERVIAAYNATTHLRHGLVIGQITELPSGAVREAIVNGIAHRDWQTPDPTTVEHTGATLVVSSPGGFIGGVNAANIITHPSKSRNVALTALLAELRVAEREGIGVDRMVRDMIRIGYPAPAIDETDGPLVRAVLIGGTPNHEWLDFLAALPPELTNDLNVLLTLRHLIDHGWVDEATLAPVLQRNPTEAGAVIEQLTTTHVTLGTDAIPVLVTVNATPIDTPPAWRYTNQTREHLTTQLATSRTPRGRATIALHWAQARQRVSTSELADLTGIAINHAGRILKDLEHDGHLNPGRTTRTGRGFFYTPTNQPNDR